MLAKGSFAVVLVLFLVVAWSAGCWGPGNDNNDNHDDNGEACTSSSLRFKRVKLTLANTTQHVVHYSLHLIASAGEGGFVAAADESRYAQFGYERTRVDAPLQIGCVVFLPPAGGYFLHYHHKQGQLKDSRGVLASAIAPAEDGNTSFDTTFRAAPVPTPEVIIFGPQGVGVDEFQCDSEDERAGGVCDLIGAVYKDPTSFAALVKVHADEWQGTGCQCGMAPVSQVFWTTPLQQRGSWFRLMDPCGGYDETLALCDEFFDAADITFTFHDPPDAFGRFVTWTVLDRKGRIIHQP